ncbi:MAG: glutamate ABC transporter substrate-binding protein [Haloechinothrix sp.]
MNRRMLAAVVAGLALAVTGCGSAGEPRDLAPIVTAQRPQPANVGGADASPGGAEASDDCKPEESFRPNGLSIPPGSTMDEIRKRGHLIAGVDQNTFLFGFYNPANGDLEGFDIDIARQVALAIFGDPSKIRFKAISSKQRIPMLKQGEVDIVVRTMTVNCERWEDINFSSVYFVAGQRLLVSKDSPATSLADLDGEKVCATKGSTSLRRIAEEQGPDPVSVDNWSDCLVLLQQGQVAAISTDDTILAGMAEQDPTTHVVGERFSSEPYGIGIPKENEDMVRYVNAVLEDVRDGTWKSLHRRWVEPVLGAENPPKPQYK